MGLSPNMIRVRCPHDIGFVHIDGACQPRSGVIRDRRRVTVPGLPFPTMEWDGGCDAAGITADVRVDQFRRNTRRVVHDRIAA